MRKCLETAQSRTLPFFSCSYSALDATLSDVKLRCHVFFGKLSLGASMIGRHRQTRLSIQPGRGGAQSRLPREGHGDDTAVERAGPRTPDADSVRGEEDRGALSRGDRRRIVQNCEVLGKGEAGCHKSRTCLGLQSFMAYWSFEKVEGGATEAVQRWRPALKRQHDSV